MADGTRPPFLKLGEIRVASDSDFQYFIELAENHEGWVQKLDRDGLIVWNRDMGKTPLKMFKVTCSLPFLLLRMSCRPSV